MAGGIFGNTFDPLKLLFARAVGQEQQQGSAPAELPGPQAAPAPAAGTGPSGGGGSGVLGGLGTALNNAFSGRGLIGDSSQDAEVDPATGIPRGIERSANNQSMMKMGIMLLAAGARQSDDSRARVLSSIPNAIGDNTDRINSFARTRLEMAKAKLIEKEQLTNDAMNKAIMARYGGGAEVQPVSNAPVGTPTPAVAANGQAPASSSAAPVAPAPSMQGPMPTPAQGATAQVGTTRPPPPAPVKWQPNQDQLMALTALKTPAEKVRYMEQQQNEIDKQEIETQPYDDAASNSRMVDKYKMVNGKMSFVGTRTVAALPERLEEKEEDGVIKQITYAPNGTIKKIDRIRDAQADKRAELADKTLSGDRERYIKTYDENASVANQSYDRLGRLRQVIKNDPTKFGTGAQIRQGFGNLLATLGQANKETIDALINTDWVGTELDRAAGEFAKAFYGPQISVVDVDNAKAAIGALKSNSKERIEAAVKRLQDGARDRIQKYQNDANRHNEAVQKRGLDEVLKVPVIDRKFDEEQQQTQAPTQQPLRATERYNPQTRKFERIE